MEKERLSSGTGPSDKKTKKFKRISDETVDSTQGATLTNPEKEKVTPEEDDLLWVHRKNFSQNIAPWSSRTIKSDKVNLAYKNDAHVAEERTVNKIEGPSEKSNLVEDSADRMIGVTQNLTMCRNLLNENAAVNQSECKILEAVVEELRYNISELRYNISELSSKLKSYSKKIVKIRSENKSILEDLKQKYGSEAVADLIEIQEKLDNGGNSPRREQL